MKNKAFTILLLLVVIGIWGFVLYRIFAAVSDQHTVPVAKAVPTPQSDPHAGYYSPRDTFTLQLTYRNPIFEENPTIKTPKEPPVEHLTENNPYIPEPAYTMPEPEPTLIYQGFVENQQNNRRVALVNIQGTSYMLGKNEQKDGFRIIRIGEESIKISYKGSTKTIYK